MKGTAFWRPLPWQQDLWLEQTSLILQQRLPHALLMIGGAGIGKRWFARALIAFALCEQRSGYACGQCRSCVQLGAGTHPNASVVGVDGHLGLAPTADGHAEQGLVHWEPDEDRKRRDITIDAARSLIGTLGLASHYGSDRYALIEPADLLNASSANALLKTIEEPPAGTHLVLVTERPQALLPTLRSRCQRLRFAAPDEAAARAWMAEQGVRDDDALRLALGAPLRALELARGDGIALRRQWADLWSAVGSGRKDPLTAAAAIDKDSVGEHLQWAQQWLTEQLRAQLGAPLPRRESIAQMMQDVFDAQRRAAGNAQPQLLMESLFVRWLRLSRAAPPVATR
ncbi:hypothetical protein [Solimonas soli]|uniref:hypothetical protein n=1 Tax=Solimonas soli TaxID=413479 RepID=UPI0004B9E182|nr:hypothetical protein [Solimonas soli]